MEPSISVANIIQHRKREQNGKEIEVRAEGELNRPISQSPHWGILGEHREVPIKIKPLFCIQEPMPSVRRRCAKSPRDGGGTELAVDRATTDSLSRIALRWLNSSWSDVTAEMTSFYKQNFKHLIPMNCEASAKYSVADKERSTKEKLDPVEPQHHEWRAQKFEELPEWRQGSYHWHKHVPSRKCYSCCVTFLPCGRVNKARIRNRWGHCPQSCPLKVNRSPWVANPLSQPGV